MALLLMLAGACFAAYRMYEMASEYKAGKNTYELVQQTVVNAYSPQQTEASLPAAEMQTVEEAPAAAEELKPFPTINFSLLEEQNPDTVGWVYIEGTNINYPVVQGADNRHYVSTMFDGSENQAGSIFMDCRNRADMSDVHTILYGHNMRDKSMFADILNYQHQEYYEAHPVGMYISPETNYSFEIVAAYVASLAENAWQLEFAAEDSISQWIDEAMEKSSIVSGIQPASGDRFITLSTCSYEFEDARFVLVGVLKDCGPLV